MDLALNNLQMLICHKTQPTNQPKNHVLKFILKNIIFKRKQCVLRLLSKLQDLTKLLHVRFPSVHDNIEL